MFYAKAKQGERDVLSDPKKANTDEQIQFIQNDHKIFEMYFFFLL